MSTFAYLVLFVSALLIQNVCSQCIGKRNIDPAFGPPMGIPCPDMGMPPFMDPGFGCPPPFYPEQPFFPMPCPDPSYLPMPCPEPPFMPMPCPDMPAPMCGCGSFGWPDYGMPGPFCGDFGIGSVDVEEPADCCDAPACEVPLITAVGFGGDAVALALSPLLEAADADVALLMFTKVKVI